VALSGVGTSWGFWISTINGDPMSNLMTALKPGYLAMSKFGQRI